MAAVQAAIAAGKRCGRRIVFMTSTQENWPPVRGVTAQTVITDRLLAPAGQGEALAGKQHLQVGIGQGDISPHLKLKWHARLLLATLGLLEVGTAVMWTHHMRRSGS
jgi:predicted component of type VI protein secretion system